MTDEEFNRLCDIVDHSFRAIFGRRNHDMPPINPKLDRLEKLLSRCRDCGRKNPENYIVRRAVWKKAIPNETSGTYGTGRGHLCIACLEKRLGRTLVDEDFGGGGVL
jgi:hypothetical protein